MSDDSDLLIAAAATAAVVTWMGTRRRERRQRGAATRDWRALARTVRTGFLRSWRETPGYQFVQAIREILSRRK
jgi:hypothetical protein